MAAALFYLQSLDAEETKKVAWELKKYCASRSDPIKKYSHTFVIEKNISYDIVIEEIFHREQEEEFYEQGGVF